MKAWKILLFFVVLGIGAISRAAGVSVTDVVFKNGAKEAQIFVNLQGNLNSTPEFTVDGKTLTIFIPKAALTKVVEQKRTIINKLDTEIIGSSSNNNTTITVKLPYSIENQKDQVSMSLRGGKVEISIPKLSSTTETSSASTDHNVIKTTTSTKITTTPTGTKIEEKRVETTKDVLNEDYLKSLEKLDEEVKTEKANAEKKNEKFVLNKDEVKTKQSATSFMGKDKSSFSLAGYAGKFVAFLGFVLLLFWGLLQLMKKGFLKRGKLGFLNGADLIQVLSTTYIAPKKSLIMVKAHDQVFLVSNTDQGMQLISEIKNTNSLFKNGEKYISGENFDTNLVSADDADNELTIKEDIYQSTAVEDAKGLQKFLSKKRKFKRLSERHCEIF